MQWFKFATSFFDDDKIQFIRSLPEKNAIIVIWVKLLTMAAKCDDSGLIYLTSEIPVDENILASSLSENLNTVKLAIQTFCKLKMITVEEGVITLNNWQKHQSSDALERLREKGRERKRAYDARIRSAKLLLKSGIDNNDIISNPDVPLHVTLQVTQSNDVAMRARTREDVDKEREKDKTPPTPLSGAGVDFIRSLEKPVQPDYYKMMVYRWPAVKRGRLQDVRRIWDQNPPDPETLERALYAYKLHTDGTEVRYTLRLAAFLEQIDAIAATCPKKFKIGDFWGNVEKTKQTQTEIEITDAERERGRMRLAEIMAAGIGGLKNV